MISNPRRAVLGIDTGGTFTDVALLDPATGRLTHAKTPSTPADPSLGFAAGISAALERSGLSGDAVGRVLHGTTVATNLILERKGAPAAMLVTAGFKYVLEIGRQDVPRRSSLFAWVKPKRPVPPERMFEIAGRMDAESREIEPLDEAAVRQAGRALAAQGVAAIAVVFLHSYANPAHERRAAEILREAHPGALVSLSSDVLPVFREYERSMTTLLNVTVMPVVSSYVARLQERIEDQGIEAPLLLMKSSGGVTGARTVQQRPVETVLSGPAAGAVGAAVIGAVAGFRDLIGIDIGGTSADISLIRGGQPGLTTRGRIGDWPLALPMVDITTIGAGGGSLARVSDDGALTVGPESAGAVPGPACYGRGGQDPTVTDAHLVLGHLPPYLLDGSFALDIEAARQAVMRIAEPLGLDEASAARGILAIADHQMVGAIRVVSVERGHDPRDFALLPFGGAGPLHGGALARLLGIRTILVPPSPGVLSALGLLASNLRAEFARTALQRAGRFGLARIAQVFEELAADATAWFDAEGVPDEARRLSRDASLRYEHQGFELTVPWAGTQVDAEAAAATVAAFHRLHERLYTFAQEDTPVELVTLRVTAEGLFRTPDWPELPPAGDISAAVTGRSVIEWERGPAEATIYDRAKLGAGARIEGPAILTQLDATTLLLPGQVATVHRLGSLVIRDDAEPQG